MLGITTPGTQSPQIAGPSHINLHTFSYSVMFTMLFRSVYFIFGFLQKLCFLVAFQTSYFHFCATQRQFTILQFLYVLKTTETPMTFLCVASIYYTHETDSTTDGIPQSCLRLVDNFKHYKKSCVWQHVISLSHSFIVWPINRRTGTLIYRGQVTRTMLPEQG